MLCQGGIQQVHAAMVQEKRCLLACFAERSSDHHVGTSEGIEVCKRRWWHLCIRCSHRRFLVQTKAATKGVV